MQEALSQIKTTKWQQLLITVMYQMYDKHYLGFTAGKNSFISIYNRGLTIPSFPTKLKRG